MDKVYDVIIIGSGPAGLSAAVYAQRAKLEAIVVEREVMSGGQILNTYEVDNYLALPGINGFDLGVKMREHADKLETEFVSGEVIKIEEIDQLKVVYMANDTLLKARTVVIATGAKYRKLDVEGEKRLTGHGVSYCATCDGAFYRNKVTAVIGGGNVAVEDAIFLSRFCEKVYVIHRRNELRADKVLQQKLLSLPNVTMLWETVVDSINGDEKVESIDITNLKTNQNSNISVDGVFVAVGMNPNSEVFEGIVEMDKGKYIIADETCRTDKKGIFAAGDIRTKQLRQIITAASDGANVITSIERYLNETV